MMVLAFLPHCLPRRNRGAAWRTRRRSLICANKVSIANEGRMRLSTRGQIFAGTGAVSLALALLNRVAFTPVDVSPFQARADILGVVCGVSLLLYGAGSAEVTERGAAVELQGTEVTFECTLKGGAADEASFVVEAALNSVQNFASVALFVGGECVGRKGLFRTAGSLDQINVGNVIRGAMKKGKIAYLADLRVVPTKEIEFAFLPRECQAIVAVPFGADRAALFGANKVRPLLGNDFGWMTALCDRLAAAIDAEN